MNTRAFETFRCDHPEQRQALAETMRFCADMENGRRRWLTLLGRSGRGKTHLARCVEVWRRSQRAGTTFYRWIDLVTDFRHDREEIYRFYKRCDMPRLMIVDDIGAGYETEFSAGVLTEIAERRLGMATLFTSNMGMEDIARLDSRIASRMIRNGGEVFTFRETPDYSLSNRAAS